MKTKKYAISDQPWDTLLGTTVIMSNTTVSCLKCHNSAIINRQNFKPPGGLESLNSGVQIPQLHQLALSASLLFDPAPSVRLMPHFPANPGYTKEK